MDSSSETTSAPLNWPVVGALYVALALGLVWMLYWGDYRNAAWLLLLGLGGALTAYGRVLEGRGEEQRAERWKTSGGLVYLVFFAWVGAVLLRVWTGG